MLAERMKELMLRDLGTVSAMVLFTTTCRPVASCGAPLRELRNVLVGMLSSTKTDRMRFGGGLGTNNDIDAIAVCLHLANIGQRDNVTATIRCSERTLGIEPHYFGLLGRPAGMSNPMAHQIE